MRTRDLLGRIGYSNIFAFLEAPSTFFFEAGMMIDADGSPRAYHIEPGKGLDYIGNAGKPGNWWALVTDTGRPGGKPIVQGPGDPAPGYYVSTTSLSDRSMKRTDPRRYVDSERIPFFVLPGNGKFGAVLGDLGFVVNPAKGRSCGAIFADICPKGKIGEGSISLAKALGVPSSPKSGGVGHGIAYVVFRGSTMGWPLKRGAIQQRSAALFEEWGGFEQLRVGLPELLFGQANRISRQAADT